MVRPMALGYAWCNGKGPCDEGEETPRNLSLAEKKRLNEEKKMK